jgi:hypothetical protein
MSIWVEGVGGRSQQGLTSIWCSGIMLLQSSDCPLIRICLISPLKRFDQ